MDNFTYALALLVVILGIAGYFKGIFTVLLNKLKSIHFKVDFSNKD